MQTQTAKIGSGDEDMTPHLTARMLVVVRPKNSDKNSKIKKITNNFKKFQQK